MSSVSQIRGLDANFKNIFNSSLEEEAKRTNAGQIITQITSMNPAPYFQLATQANNYRAIDFTIISPYDPRLIYHMSAIPMTNGTSTSPWNFYSWAMDLCSNTGIDLSIQTPVPSCTACITCTGMNAATDAQNGWPACNIIGTPPIVPIDPGIGNGVENGADPAAMAAMRQAAMIANGSNSGYGNTPYPNGGYGNSGYPNGGWPAMNGGCNTGCGSNKWDKKKKHHRHHNKKHHSKWD